MSAPDSPLTSGRPRIAEGLSIAAKLPTSSAHQEALPQAQALLGASSINVAKALALYRKPFDPAAAQALLLPGAGARHLRARADLKLV